MAGGIGGWWQSREKKDRQRLVLLGAGLLLGIALMCRPGPEKKTAVQPEAEAPALSEGLPGPETLESQVEALLSQVKGAGRVRVMLTYGESAASVYAYDNSSRVTSSESSQTNDTEARLVEIDDRPVLVSTVQPRVRGVVAVAEGAGDPVVRERLQQALCSLLGINAAQIAILEAEGSVLEYEDR